MNLKTVMMGLAARAHQKSNPAGTLDEAWAAARRLCLFSAERRFSMKKSMTIRLEEALLEHAKNAVWHVGKGLTITGLIEQVAIRERGAGDLPPRSNFL